MRPDRAAFKSLYSAQQHQTVPHTHWSLEFSSPWKAEDGRQGPRPTTDEHSWCVAECTALRRNFVQQNLGRVGHLEDLFDKPGPRVKRSAGRTMSCTLGPSLNPFSVVARERCEAAVDELLLDEIVVGLDFQYEIIGFREIE